MVKKSRKSKYLSLKEFEEKKQKDKKHDEAEEFPSSSRKNYNSTVLLTSKNGSSNDTSRKNSSDWNKEDISKNYSNEGKTEVKAEDMDDSKAHSFVQEMHASETPCCSQAGSTEPMSVQEISNRNYNVADVTDGVINMGLEQANSSGLSSDFASHKNVNDRRETESSVQKNYRISSDRNNMKKQRFSKTKNNNVDENWRENKVHRHANISEDWSKIFENEPRSNRRDQTTQDDPKESSSTYFEKLFYDISCEEKKKFTSHLKSKNAHIFVKVKQEDRDLFDVGEEYALVHCVAEDMSMGAGIAIEFRSKFKRVAELLDQRAKSGGLAYLNSRGRFIYYLVTKTISHGKPTYDSLWSSLTELRKNVKKNEVKKLAMPLIGCGLDRLDWDVVKPMLEFIFRDEDVEILCCNFVKEGQSTSAPIKKSRIVYNQKSVTEIEPETIILYFASKDGKPTNEMMNLDEKFNFVSNFQKAPKNVGEVVRLVPTNIRNYVLYGCIVKENYSDPFNFGAFQKCILKIKKNYNVDNFYYAAFQKMSDESDKILNEKILNLMKHSLSELEIYVCGCEAPSE